jgi:hypothetical protein
MGDGSTIRDSDSMGGPKMKLQNVLIVPDLKADL